MTFTRALSTNNYGPAKFIVSALTYEGTHSTIQAAITAASSGDTIFIRPGTYTENLTLKVGVNLAGYGCDSSLTNISTVIIKGTCTLTTAGTVTISGVQLQTNSAALLAVTGTLASIVNLNNCYLNCTNATGITHSSSNAASEINISYCNGNIGTTGISLFTSTSAGNMYIYYSRIANSGLATTASTVSTGAIFFSYTIILFPLSTSSVGLFFIGHCSINTSGVNTACITTAGTGVLTTITYTVLSSGTASCLSIGSGTAIAAQNTQIASSNTNAATGAGSFSSINVAYVSTSIKSNVTTQTGGLGTGLTQGTAPSVGMIGELITAQAAANSVALVTTTAKTITSISLTPGIWDVSGGVQMNGGAGTASSLSGGINTTTNNLGTVAVNYFDGSLFLIGVRDGSAIIPPYRYTLSTTTTIYLVGYAAFTGTCNAGGRISATRVG